MLLVCTACPVFAQEWRVVPQGIKNTDLQAVVSNAVEANLKQNGGFQSLRQIPVIEVEWMQLAKQQDQKWQHTFNQLQENWQNSLEEVATKQEEVSIREEIERQIGVIKDNIRILQNLNLKREQAFIDRLKQLRLSILVWGKIPKNDIMRQKLSYEQVQTQAEQQLGAKAIEAAKAYYANYLPGFAVKMPDNWVYTIASTFPEDISELDANNTQWIYFFRTIEVYPFVEPSRIAPTAPLKALTNALLSEEQIDILFEKEHLFDSGLKDWLRDELIIQEAQTVKLETDLERARHFGRGQRVLQQEVTSLKRRIEKQQEEKSNLADAKSLNNALILLSNNEKRYFNHYSKRTVLTSQQVMATARGQHDIKDFLVNMAAKGWKKYQEPSYRENILVKNRPQNVYTTYQLNWIAQKTAFKILSLTRRKIGVQTQYMATFGIRLDLTASKTEKPTAKKSKVAQKKKPAPSTN